MADKFYLSFPEKVAKREVNFDTSSIYICLLTDSYNPANSDSHVYLSDIQASEVAAGGGYTQGGQLLVTMPAGLVKNAGTKTYSIVAPANPQWPASTISARYGAIYVNTTVPSTSVLIALLDFGEVISSSSSLLEVPLREDGIIIDINAGASDVGYQYHLDFILRAYSDNPFNFTQNRAAELLANTYTPDYETHNDDVSTFSHITNSFGLGASLGSLEADGYAYRITEDSYVFNNFTGAFRYLLVRQSNVGSLASCIDLGDIDISVSQTVVFTMPDGYLKLKLDVEAPQ